MSKKSLSIILIPIDYFFMSCVWIYKIFISPLKPKTCRFTPTCSTYMINAIKEYHFVKGIFIGIKRLLRCSPKNKGGFDPVPPNIKGDIKWLI